MTAAYVASTVQGPGLVGTDVGNEVPFIPWTRTTGGLVYDAMHIQYFVHARCYHPESCLVSIGSV